MHAHDTAPTVPAITHDKPTLAQTMQALNDSLEIVCASLDQVFKDATTDYRPDHRGDALQSYPTDKTAAALYREHMKAADELWTNLGNLQARRAAIASDETMRRTSWAACIEFAAASAMKGAGGLALAAATLYDRALSSRRRHSVCRRRETTDATALANRLWQAQAWLLALNMAMSTTQTGDLAVCVDVGRMQTALDHLLRPHATWGETTLHPCGQAVTVAMGAPATAIPVGHVEWPACPSGVPTDQLEAMINTAFALNGGFMATQVRTPKSTCLFKFTHDRCAAVKPTGWVADWLASLALGTHEAPARSMPFVVAGGVSGIAFTDDGTDDDELLWVRLQPGAKRA